MDHLAGTHGVRQFILMGNCALANICVNTAIIDRRVAGLIATNPYVPENFPAWLAARIRRNALHLQSWLRLLRGELHVQRRPQPEELELSRYGGNVALPRDFPRRLQQLVSERGLRILIAFSRREPGLLHFRQHYRRELNQMAAANQLRFEVLPTDCHDFSDHDDAAAKLNELIGEWMRSSWETELISRSGCTSPTAIPAAGHPVKQ